MSNPLNAHERDLLEARICPYCGSETMLVDSEFVYGPGRKFGYLYCCARFPACHAYVGCHRKTTDPLGRLADKRLREAKQRAHAAFDPLWKAKLRLGYSKHEARTAGYRWLSRMMGLPVELTHVGMFDVEQCERVFEICQPFTQKIRGAV